MKIAIYVSSLKGGGAERVMLYLAQGLLEQNHSVDILLARYEGDYIEQVPESATIIPLKKASRLQGFLLTLRCSELRLKLLLLCKFRLPRFLTRVPAVTQYIKSNKPDAIISALHSSNLSAVLAKSCAKSDTRIIVSEHISLSSFIASVPSREKKLLPFISMLYAQADHIVAVSEGVKKDLSDITNIPIDRITTINNPVITPKMLQLMKENIEHPWLNKPEFFTLLAVGRLTKQKDYPTLIAAIELLKDTLPLKLIILGEGSEREKLQTLIEKNNLSNIIDLHGFSDNPFAFMMNADLFVLSSILEGLPMVLFEALACGCRVVSTDCPYGPSEILKNGKYGMLVSIKNSIKLAKAIEESYNVNSVTGSQPQDYALNFTIEKATLEYLELIEL